jgi:hypothetical protein
MRLICRTQDIVISSTTVVHRGITRLQEEPEYSFATVLDSDYFGLYAPLLRTLNQAFRSFLPHELPVSPRRVQSPAVHVAKI